MFSRVAPLALALVSSSALAQAEREETRSAEIELLRPSFSPDGALGVDTPWRGASGTVRAGLHLAWSHEPLVLRLRGQPDESVIGDRLGAQVGVSTDIGSLASLRLVLPMAAQWGGEPLELAGDGLGLGDVRAGLRVVPPSRGGWSAGLRADLSLPTGATRAWLGEGRPRIGGGALVGARSRRLSAALDLGVQVRADQDTGLDLVLGDEATLGLQGGLAVWPERLELRLALLHRRGLAPGSRGEGAQPVELLLGTHLPLGEALGLDLGLGQGLNAGYGTPSPRALASLVWSRTPPPPPRVVGTPGSSLRVAALPDEPLEAEPPPPEPPPPEPQADDRPLARVEEDRVTLREPIRFQLGTAVILEESQPTLDALSQLLGEERRITHLLIEGHASAEGGHAYNYELSLARARAIWEALVARGVAPERLSFRALGEIRPLPGLQPEDPRNRRVELRILLWQPDDAPAPEAPARPAIPWREETSPSPEPTP